MPSLTFEGLTVEYEIDIVSFDPGSPATYHDPGSGCEVEVDRFASVLVGGHTVGVVPLDVALLDFAAAEGIVGVPRYPGETVFEATLARAMDRIEDQAIDVAADAWSEAAADGYEDEWRAAW